MSESALHIQQSITPRSFIFGFVFAMLMCGVNSYLTLTFGIIEEGPTIAVAFFFTMVMLIKGIKRFEIRPATAHEMVVVATMGSAGGSLGFIANFFAAQEMVGAAFGFIDMVLFCTVSSIIGLTAVILLRQILIVMDERLPEDQQLKWVGGRIVRDFIQELLGEEDSRQPRILVVLLGCFIFYVVFNESGVGWFPEVRSIAIFGLAAFGVKIAFSPFTVGAASLMGMRTCVGFFVGAVALYLFSRFGLVPETPTRPDKFIWPGIAFLVTAGLTPLILHWRITADALKGLVSLRTGDGDDDPIMSPRKTILFASVATVLVTLCLLIAFKLSIVLILTALILGGIILNLIATRAAAQTYFNPARVMGVILMGVFGLMGGSSAGTSLTGAGFVAGSGAQGGNLTNDMWYGRQLKFPSSWQFWTQALTIIPCAIIAAAVSLWIMNQYTLTIDTTEIAAPIAKIWAAAALLFDPSQNQELPKYAIESMWIAGIAGVVWAWLESKPDVRGKVPCSIGFGLALILPIYYSMAFFAAGVFVLLILKRFARVSNATINTLAIAGIMGEGIGGILTAFLKIMGVIG